MVKLDFDVLAIDAFLPVGSLVTFEPLFEDTEIVIIPDLSFYILYELVVEYSFSSLEELTD